MVEQAKLTASDAADDDVFGWSVGLSGNTVVVGAWADDDNELGSGSAYVYTRIGLAWTEEAKLTASDGGAFDLFGRAVSISGDTAVVGAIGNDEVAGNAGAAYVFLRSGTIWSQQAKLTASDGELVDEFGGSVSVDGDTVVVGVPREDGNGTGSGSAYVYVRDGTTWSQEAKLTPHDGAPNDQFGISVSISGDTIFIGALKDDDNGDRSGSTYVYERSGSAWTLQTKLAASDAASGDEFGISVSVDEDIALIGAHLDDDLGFQSGSAYVFERSGGSWAEQAKLTASDGTVGGGFGPRVAISGDAAIVGAFQHSHTGTASGSSYLYVRSGSTWTELAELIASDSAAFDLFGLGVAISGATAVVGAPFGHADGIESGSAYVYQLPDSDFDGIPDTSDSCPNDPEDPDGFEDEDGCPDPDNDGDGVLDAVDNCMNTSNANQVDVDFDGVGDSCDSEGASPNVNGVGGTDDCADSVDNDGDTLTDGDDVPCDGDGDSVADVEDTCPLLFGVPELSGCPLPGPPLAVGGIASLLEADDRTSASTSEPRTDNIAPLVALAALTAAVLIAGGWYTRRRWLR